MFKFSNYAGRIIGQVAPSLGQGLKSIKGPEEASKIIFSPGVTFAKTGPSLVKGSRATIRAAKEGYGEMSAAVLEKYRHYQVDDGTPIHLKGGQGDKVMYYLTLGMCALGLEECFRYYYSAAFPKKAS